jgi:hypothetical protein
MMAMTSDRSMWSYEGRADKDLESDWFAPYWSNRGQALRDEKDNARKNQGIDQWSLDGGFTAGLEFVEQLSGRNRNAPCLEIF